MSKQSWRDRVKDVYPTLAQLKAYNEQYGIAARCGFSSAAALWNANPVIGGSTDPAAFGLAKGKFLVTYEVVTHESAKHADAEERGFVLPSGTRVELGAEVYGKAAGVVKEKCGLTLREACDLIGLVEDSGTWFTTIDPVKNYGTGDETTFSLHPPEKITAASYGRLRRLLKVR